MKRKSVLIFTILFTLFSISNLVFAETSSNLTDISNHWAKENIELLIEKRAINGYENNTFRPNETMTRAEFTKILVNILHEDPGNAPYGHWAGLYVDKAVEEGYATKTEYGYGKGYDEKITRGEIARMLSRALDEEPINTEELKTQIVDFSQISFEYQEHVAKVYAAGIITGYPDGEFKPNNTATRAEATTMILRFLDESRRQIPEIIIVEENKYNILSDFESVPLKEVDILKNGRFKLADWGNFGTEEIQNVYFLKESDLPVRIGNVVIEKIDFGYDPYDWESLFVSGYVVDGYMSTGTLPMGLIYRNEAYQHKIFTTIFQEYYDMLAKKYPNMKGLMDNNNPLESTLPGEKFTYIARFAQKGRFDYIDYNFNDLTHISFYNYFLGKDIVVFENFL